MAPPLKHRLHRLFRTIISYIAESRRAGKTQITQIIILVSGFWFLVSASYAQPERYIRVAIVQGAESINLNISGSYKISAPADKKTLSYGDSLKTMVASYKNRILIGPYAFNRESVLISAAGLGQVEINGRAFKGDIQFIRNESGKLDAINYIDLEDYVKGILYHEASHYWPMEALKAQAVASRTYAVYQCRKNQAKAYDVTSSVYSQVYGGMYSERLRTNRAVEETQGHILTYQDEVFPAYFHATCAGHTEDASALWDIDIPPLKGVSCGFCKDSPHFNWHYVLSLKEIQDKLNDAGYNINNIREIKIMGKDNSGRITNLSIVSPKKAFRLSAKDFRGIFGVNLIRSTNFNVAIEANDAVFEGFGWGHGVGLCQWGAYFMAKQGFGYEEILKYYYPKADVKTI